MTANDIVTTVREFNSHEREIWHNITDKFIATVKQEITQHFNDDQYVEYLVAKELVIFISDIDYNFKDFTVSPIPRLTKISDDEASQKFYIPIEEFFSKESKWHGSYDTDSGLLRRFANALTEKGFKVFYSKDNDILSVIVDLC